MAIPEIERVSFSRVVECAAEFGLTVRGAFHAKATDDIPDGPNAACAKSMVLLGNAGPGMWEHFCRSPEFSLSPNPLDRWSERVVGKVAEDLGGWALFPFGGPPFLPFVRWASRAEGLGGSPIGPLVHPQYGLWHAYRGAVALDRMLADIDGESLAQISPSSDADGGGEHPCDQCEEKPCTTRCPVGAFSPKGYDTVACAKHLGSDAGAQCLYGGCLARHACPVGQDYAYAPAQAEFHMRAFIGNRVRLLKGSEGGT